MTFDQVMTVRGVIHNWWSFVVGPVAPPMNIRHTCRRALDLVSLIFIISKAYLIVCVNQRTTLLRALVISYIFKWNLLTACSSRDIDNDPLQMLSLPIRYENSGPGWLSIIENLFFYLISQFCLRLSTWTDSCARENLVMLCVITEFFSFS